jgi:hypothetical protein
MDLPNLKTDPKYGFYPWWPEDGDDWVHPEDVATARHTIPSPRVFRRDGEHGPFVTLHYGRLQLRVKPTMWQEVPWEGYDVGSWVEVLSRGQKNTPRTGVIREMEWEPRSRSMRYYIEEAGHPIPNAYTAEDLRHVEPVLPLGDPAAAMPVIEPPLDVDASAQQI